MSHFSQIKTQIRSLPALESALSNLGIDWKSGPLPIRGYQGATETAEVVIPQENGYDIGFRWNGEQYELVADIELWNQEFTVERFLNKVTQQYALSSVLTATTTQGFQVSKQEQDAEGNIRLVVQRWSS